jgi:hypothetical protein
MAQTHRQPIYFEDVRQRHQDMAGYHDRQHHARSASVQMVSK